MTNQPDNVDQQNKQDAGALDNRAQREHESGTLGGRSARVLLLSPSRLDSAAREAAGLAPMPRLRNLLEAAEHTVSLSVPNQWQQAVSATRPEIVFIEVESEGGNLEEAAQICREIKRHPSSPITLAVLASSDEDAQTKFWREMRNAGADDFIAGDITRLALEARVLLLLRAMQTRHDLEVVRERLARQSQIDEVTQLLNRRFFFQSAHRECSRARRYGHKLACLMVDIDYLDEIGKTFGYPCVEYVLRAVAYTVRQWTRDSDVAGRFSERKFAVLLPETDVQGAMTVREKILSAIGESQYVWEGKELPLSVSIGESERRSEGVPRIDEPATNFIAEDGTSDDEEHGEEESVETEPLSVREELAALLEDADAALNVARRSSMRPDIFVQYTPGEQQ